MRQPRKREEPESVRQRRVGENICRDSVGIEAMDPCPECRASRTTCMVKKGYKKCGPCMKKGMSCGGNFSQANFDKWDKKRAELEAQAATCRHLMKVFKRQLEAQRKQLDRVQEKIDKIVVRRDAMLDHEARALGLMDEMGDNAAPDDQFDFNDPLFLQDDPNDMDLPFFSLDVAPSSPGVT